jgi:hypothetical protein
VNANDATLTELTTAQTGSTVHDHVPSAPVGGAFGLILRGGRRQRPGQPRRALHADDQRDRPDHSQPTVGCRRSLHPAFDAASRWKLSGTGPD